MNLQPPAQVFSTTLYDRHQPQSISFVFIPARSLPAGVQLDFDAVRDLVEPGATFFQTIAPSYLPAALASLLDDPSAPNPFLWAVQPPESLWIHPNSLGFAEYVAFSEAVPIEESTLKSKSLMAVAVTTGAKIGLVAGGVFPFVLMTVPAGIILCTSGAAFGPALGNKVSKLIGA